MVRYLKYIVIVFGSIGLMAGSFFYYQNRVDISAVFKYKDKIDYEYVRSNCPEAKSKCYYPCLKKEFTTFLEEVSFTGTNMGLKLMFNAMEEDKVNCQKYFSKSEKNIAYAIHYLDINNLAIRNSYQRYHGISNLYGGYISTLNEYKGKAYSFSDNLVSGLESPSGLSSLKNEKVKTELSTRFESIRTTYFKIKDELEKFTKAEYQKIKSKE